MGRTAVKRFEVAPDFGQVGQARRFVRRELVDAPSDVTEDMQLVVSELVSNAIEHGAAEPVRVEIRVTGTDVELSVVSHGFAHQLPELEVWRVAAASAVSGRGLGIVRSLADHVDVVRVDDSVAVTVSRRLQA